MNSMSERRIGAAKVPGHRNDLVIVDAPLYDHVDLDRTEAGGRSSIDAGEHIGDGEVDVVHALEHRVV